MNADFFYEKLKLSFCIKTQKNIIYKLPASVIAYKRLIVWASFYDRYTDLKKICTLFTEIQLDF